MTPLISVVMSVFNGETYLAESVESILRQEYRNWELVVLDDGSTDRTSEILRRYSGDSRVRLVRQGNAGLTRALCRGIEMANGTYIARQDADDVSKPDRLGRQIEYAMQRGYDLIGSDIDIIDERGRLVATDSYRERLDMLEHLLRANDYTHGTLLFRKDIVEPVYREKFLYSQDYDLSLRAASSRRLGYVDSSLYMLRRRKDSISQARRHEQNGFAALANAFARQRMRDGIDSYETWDGRPFPGDWNTDPRFRKDYYAFLARQYLRQKYPMRAVRHFLESLAA